MKNESILLSFKNAFRGIFSGIRKERNMLIHVIAMLTVIICGMLFKIEVYEWLICILLFALVIGSELINTAIENTVDICAPEYNELAKIAKDTSAGAVLVFALTSVVCGLIIFIPHFFNHI